jgi:hypothetical protein
MVVVTFCFGLATIKKVTIAIGFFFVAMKKVTTSWEMPWLCKGEMIKRLLVTLVPKHGKSGVNW